MKKIINKRYSIAMMEFLHYLKGIKKEDIDKIPISILRYFEKNADSEYVCDFDYTKPLKELNLKKETIALINIICFKYWCITETQKRQYLERLSENEQRYQRELYEKYNPNNIFKNKKTESIETTSDTVEIVEYKESIFKQIINKIKNIFARK